MKLILRLAALSLAVLATACSSPSFQEEPSGEFGDQGLYPVRSTGFDEVHARRDAGLSSYPGVLIEPLRLDGVTISGTMVPGTTQRDWQITENRGATLTDAWQSAMSRAFADYDQSGEGGKVLRISSSLTDIRGRTRSVTGATAAGVPAAAGGNTVDVSMEVRLYDRTSGELLGVIRDQRDVLLVQWTRADGRDLVNLFNSWASLLEARVSGR